MKTNVKRELYRWSIIVLLAAILVGFTQCIGQKASLPSEYHSTGTVQVPSPGLEAERPDIVEEAPDIGVKDYERTLHTMSQLTGVPISGNVLTAYNDRLKAQLPYNSRIEGISETNILGAAKLASEFCDVLLNTAALRTQIWPAATFNFGQNSATFWGANSPTRPLFIQLMLQRFWGADVLPPEEYAEGQQVLDELVTAMTTAVEIDGATVAAPASNATTTLNVAKTLCTSALSSAQVILQ